MAQDWRVGHVGRDCIYYEERIAGHWQRIELSGEMLVGRPHHVLYFDTPARWKSYPEWARDRRTEIISRVKRACPAPDYAYQGEFEMEDTLSVQRVTVTITRPGGSTIIVEPWANEYEARSGETWEVELTGPACGCTAETVVENEQERVTVWGWTGCTYKVFRNRELVDRSDNRVPEIPRHDHGAPS